LYFVVPSALSGIEQVTSAKLLGVIFKYNLSFNEHAAAILKCCSQRAYILKLLCDQGISQIHFDTVFHALIMSKSHYALRACGGYLTQTQKGMIKGFLRRMYKYHFISECFEIDVIMDNTDKNILNVIFPSPLFASFTPSCKKQSTCSLSQGP